MDMQQRSTANDQMSLQAAHFDCWRDLFQVTAGNP